MTLLNYLWEYLVNFIEVILFFIMINSKLNLDHKIPFLKSKVVIFLGCRFAILCVMNHYGMNSLLTISSSCIIEVIFAVLFYTNSIGKKIFWGFIFSIICLVTESIQFFTLTIVMGHDLEDMMKNGELRIPIGASYLALVAFFVLISQFIGKKDLVFSNIQKISVCILGFGGMIASHYILYTTWIHSQNYMETELSVNLILINIIFNIYLIIVVIGIYYMGSVYAEKNRFIVRQKQTELEVIEYKNLCENFEALREMKHDIQFHLETIKSFADMGNLEELHEYLNEYGDYLEETQIFLATGVPAIDCILSAKIKAAVKAGIHTDYSVVLEHDFQLDAFSLSSLLGNLWNNAIEAVGRITDAEQRKQAGIYFYIKPFQDMIAIHIENDYEGDLVYNTDGTILSSKGERGHGLGLKRVFDIVNSVNGLIQISTDASVFSIHILLPKKD